MLAILTLDGQPVASLFGFNYDGKLVIHTLAFDPDYHQFHCGLVCILKVMQTLRETGIHTVDFTRGAESYKTFFADIPTLSYEAILMRTTRARVLYGTFLHGKDIVMKYPKLRELLGRAGFSVSGVDREALMKLRSRPEANGDETSCVAKL